MKLKNLCEPRVMRFDSVPSVRKKIKQVVNSFLQDGLVTTNVTYQEFSDYGDEHKHFRDFGLQTLIQVEATDLLQPMSPIQSSVLSVADSVNLATVQVSRVDELVKSSHVKPIEPVVKTDSVKSVD